MENIFLGVFDIIIIFILIIFNIIYFFKLREIDFTMGCLKLIIWSLIFGLILPIISMKIEINNVYKANEAVDSFNLLYTYFRFPVYWCIGIIECLIVKFMNEER